MSERSFGDIKEARDGTKKGARIRKYHRLSRHGGNKTEMRGTTVAEPLWLK